MARSSRSTSVTKKPRAKPRKSTTKSKPRKRTGPKRKTRSRKRASPPPPPPPVLPSGEPDEKISEGAEESTVRPPYEEGIFYATRTGGPLDESQEQRRPFRFRKTPWRFFFMIMSITVLIGFLIYQRVAIANALRRKKTEGAPQTGTTPTQGGGEETTSGPSVFETNRVFFIVVAVVFAFFLVFAVLRFTGFGSDFVAGFVNAIFPKKQQPPPSGDDDEDDDKSQPPPPPKDEEEDEEEDQEDEEEEDEEEDDVDEEGQRISAMEEMIKRTVEDLRRAKASKEKMAVPVKLTYKYTRPGEPSIMKLVVDGKETLSARFAKHGPVLHGIVKVLGFNIKPSMEIKDDAETFEADKPKYALSELAKLIKRQLSRDVVKKNIEKG